MPPARSCARVNTTVLVPDGLKPERPPSTGTPAYVVSFTGFHAEDYNTSTHGGDAAKESRASTSPPHFDCTYAEYAAHVTAIGGRLLPSVTRKTTLLVAWRGLTHKRLTAERFNIPVVRPEWLVEAARGGAGSRAPNTGAYAVPKLYGYTFCTSGLTCEELRAFAHILERNGGTAQGTLTHWCDALFVSPEHADLLCRQRRQGAEPRCQAPSSVPVAEDLTSVSAKVRFAWEYGIPIMSYQRFLQLANLDVSLVPPTHKNDRLRGREPVNAFDAIVELCAIPSVFQSTSNPLQEPAMTDVEYISEEDANESDEGDMSVGSTSEKDEGLADAVETGMENYYTAPVPLSQYERRTCTANEAEDMIQDANPEPPLTLAVNTPDYFLGSPSEQLVGDENRGDLVRDYYRTHPADAAKSMLKATVVKEAASTSRCEHVDATRADQPACEYGGPSPPAAVPLPTMMLYHHPPTLSVCLLGFQGKERDAAVRMCVACRFMRTPVPTRETDIIILGSGAVKIKKKVTDLRRRRQLRGNPHNSFIAKTVTYYECTPELVRELRIHYGIGMHQIVAASWLRSCMKTLEQTLGMDDVGSGRPTVAVTATAEETAEGLLMTPSHERVTQRVSGGGAEFYPGMAIPIELLPGTQQRQYRVHARRWVAEEPSAPPSTAPPPLPPTPANTRAGLVPHLTTPPVSAETAAPRTAQSTAAANETLASPAIGAPPASTVVVKPSAHTGEQTQYQRERERATALLDGFLRILSTATGSSPQAARETEETDYTRTLVDDVADVFSDCLVCFVGGEFARTELAVVRGLIRVGRGTPLKKTIAQWCQVLQKKPVNTSTDNGEQAELTVEERRAEVIRRHTILGKKMRQIFGGWMAAVDARRGAAGRQETGVDWPPQTSAAALLHASKSALLSAEAFSMQDETSTQWMAPVPPADRTNCNRPGEEGEPLRTKLQAISQICLAHPVLYVVPHHHQRCAQSDPTPAKETSREDTTESRRRGRSPLRYLVTVTMDYILCSLAARRRLDPCACFLFTEPIPSPTDLLLRHPQTTKQSMTRSTSFPETPGLSKWVWQRRYAKTQSVGVCVSFVWLLAAAGGTPGSSASSRSPVSRSQQPVLDVLPDTQLAPLLRALLLGLHSVVHALGGTVQDLFEPAAVTHVVVVDVEAIVRSSLQSLYNGGSTDSPSVDGNRVSWPPFAWEVALHHARNDDVSVVNVTWLRDSLRWGQFVDEAKETYACPSGMPREQPETAGGTPVVSVTRVRAELNQPNPKDGTPSGEDGADTTLRPAAPPAVYRRLERGVPMADAFDFAAPVTTPLVSRQKPAGETPLPASGTTPRQMERLCTSPFHIRNSKLRAASQSSRCGGALLTGANGGSLRPSGHHSRTTITIEDQQHPSESSEPDVAPIGKTGPCPSLGFVTSPPHFAPPVEASEPTTELLSPPPPHTSTPIRAPPEEAIRCCHSTPVAPHPISVPTISRSSNASMMPPLYSQNDDGSPLSPPPHPSLVVFDPGSTVAEQHDDLAWQCDSQSARLIPWNPSSPSLQPVPSQSFEGDDLASPTQCSLLEFPPSPSPWHSQPPLNSSFEFLDSCDRTVPLPASPLAETVDYDNAVATADAPEVRRMLLLSAVTSAGNSRHMPIVSPPHTQPLSQEAAPTDVGARQAEATGIFPHPPPTITTETPTTANQTRSSEEITQSTSGRPTSGHKRPRLAYTSVSPIPRLEDALVVLDQSRENDPLARTPPTPESCVKYISRSFVHNISLIKRATPPPAAPTSCIRALSSTKPQTEIAPAGSERHTPLRVYLQHDLPNRKGLLARLSEVVSQLQPSLLTPEDGKPSTSPRDDHFGPVEFVEACEHADCIVTHDLSPRESVLVAIAAGLWVLRPSFLVHMVERIEVERCAGEWWAGVQSSRMHRFLELHEWSREAMPWNAPPLHTELAKQCVLRRKQWQQHGQRVFDQLVFILCFRGEASGPLPAPNERQEVSSMPTAVPSLAKNSSATSVDSNLAVQHGEQQAPTCPPTLEPVAAGCELQRTDAAATIPYPLSKKISAIQRLIKAGGGEVGDILRLEGMPASPTDAPADRERCPRWFHSTHAPFSEDAVKGNPTDLDGAHEAEVDPFLTVMAQVLCTVLVTHGTSPVVTPGGVAMQCPPPSKPRELVVLLDSTVQTELPATTADPSAPPVPHSVRSWWLDLMFAASHRSLAQRNQLAACLQRAHQELSKQDRTASTKVVGPAPRNDRFPKRVRSTSLPVPALNLIVDTKRQPHPTSPTNMSTCPLTHTVITALQHAASISHPVGWVAADMSEVARVSVKSMSWLARYIAGQSGLDTDPSISFGALDFL